MPKISHRYLHEMADMFGTPGGPIKLYTMKRDVARKGELRKDEITMPAMVINGHFNKTKGHTHIMGHNELYHVVSGEAFFFMQKGNEKKKTVSDCYGVLAKAGQSVVISGEYAHFTINVGPKPLKMYNWISDISESEYKFIEDMKGACFYFFKDKQGGILEQKNPMYRMAPKIVRLEKALDKLPTKLDFLL